MIVIGAIFFGIATATEVGRRRHRRRARHHRLAAAASRGACCATSARRTVRTTAMVVAILVGAFFLNVIIQTIGLTQQLSKLITQYQLTPVQVLIGGDRALPGARAPSWRSCR